MEQNKIRNVKNMFAAGLIIILLISLCSCGLTVTETDNSVPKTTAETTSEVSATTAVSEASTEEETTYSETKSAEKSSEKITSQKMKEKTSVSKRTAQTQKKQITCTFEISCENILDNKDKLKENKSAFLPENGKILDSVIVKVPKGSTAFDVIKKACAENICTDNCQYCKKNGIHLDFVYTPGYDNYYIRGIHQIYEKDCGSQSGWMYSVNGSFPNYGCSEYKVKDGDVIRFLYTCSLGDDLGAEQ